VRQIGSGALLHSRKYAHRVHTVREREEGGERERESGKEKNECQIKNQGR